MTKKQIYEHIKQLLIEKFDVEEAKITPETNIVLDLDFDSIDIVDMIVELNKIIKLTVAAEDFKHVRTLDDITNVIFSLIHNVAK